MTDIDIERDRAIVAQAHEEVSRLCMGPDAGRWRMTVPAQEDRDSDLVISNALLVADRALGALADTQAEGERLRRKVEHIEAAGADHDLRACSEFVRETTVEVVDGRAARAALARVEALCDEKDAAHAEYVRRMETGDLITLDRFIGPAQVNVADVRAALTGGDQ